jgi:ATP-dependent helicase Lhr and Lhr-like helicase
MVVLRDGDLLGWLGRAGHALLTFDRDADALRELARTLGALVDGGDRRALLVSTIDGVPAAESPIAATFVAAGFTSSSRGLLKRRAGTPQGTEVEVAQ